MTAPVRAEAGGRRVGTSRHGVMFWLGVVVGGGMMAFGLLGLWSDQRPGQVLNWAVYLVGLDLLHDALVAPVVCGAGVLAARLLPGPWRAYVQAALGASAVVLLVAWAPLASTAEQVGNPTIQPLDYPTAVLTALGIVWSVCLGLAAVVALRAARAGSRPGRSTPPAPGHTLDPQARDDV